MDKKFDILTKQISVPLEELDLAQIDGGSKQSNKKQRGYLRGMLKYLGYDEEQALATYAPGINIKELKQLTVSEASDMIENVKFDYDIAKRGF